MFLLFHLIDKCDIIYFQHKQRVLKMNINKFNEILISSKIEHFENENFKSFEFEILNENVTIVTIVFDEPYFEKRTYYVRNNKIDEEEIEFEN